MLRFHAKRNIATPVNSFICESRSFACNTPLKTILGELQIKVHHVFFNEQMSWYTKGPQLL